MRPEDYKNIPSEKFALVNENKKLRDKELVTKPIGFFRDALNRFAKNKGSIVGAAVIGLLVLYALIAPLFSPYTVSYNDIYYANVLPRLFDSEYIDFMDGGKNKTTNLSSFAYYYSMGAETGHNAVKRQQYTRYLDSHGIESFDFRVDTYQAVGTVFMFSVPRADYLAIQDYQDRAGVQVIYPITDSTKRAKLPVNNTNANIWYETKTVEGVDVPVNYTVDEDGTYQFKNIYLPYQKPAMSSAYSVNEAVVSELIAADGGYHVRFSRYTKDKDTSGNTISIKKLIGYIVAVNSEGMDTMYLTEEKDEASVFIFDNTYNTIKTMITGHADIVDDVYYYFGFPAERGSEVSLHKFSDIDNPDVVPFKFYNMEDKSLITAPTEETEYYFAGNRQTSSTKKFYISNFSSSLEKPGTGNFTIMESKPTKQHFQVESDGGSEYYLIFKNTLSSTYIGQKVEGNDNLFTATSNKADSTKWTYDVTKKTFKATINGHTDASLDGDYYFAIDVNNNAISLAKEDGVDGTNIIFMPFVDENLQEITTFTEGAKYYFSLTNVTYSSALVYANGEFKGDNYNSRMRIEGDGVYKYSYAYQKDGGNFEIRVNYYEYYRYYHQEILHDKITKPYFLFGTTDTGQDIFTCLASGARFSFVMAIAVAIVNMVVGAIYGAIEGYYGGKVDMIMERIVEILSAVPFMIVITLLKYHMGGTSQALILFIAFFLTGWIGESGTVRMQFYRFKNQEYVLAARTLGANDPRIMFKHIFPNALGTIITSSVLIIPGMIFSETSLSYLGIINLNSGNMTSVGTLLANAQPYLATYPHMIVFPAIFISLLMLCFNLFGNGLRDAFNPSLRGTED